MKRNLLFSILCHFKESLSLKLSAIGVLDKTSAGRVHGSVVHHLVSPHYFNPLPPATPRLDSAAGLEIFNRSLIKT